MSRSHKRPRPVGGPRPSGHRVTHPRGSSRPHNGNTGAAASRDSGCALFAVLLLAIPAGVLSLAAAVAALAFSDFTA